MFGKNWQGAEGVVLARDVASVTDGSITYRYIVEVWPDGLESFRAIAKPPIIAVDFWPPDVGQTVGVLFDARSHSVRFDRHDPRLSARAHERDRRLRFDATLREHPRSRRATDADRLELLSF